VRRFVFSLQPVLNYRRIREEALLTELAVLQADYQRRKGELSRLVALRDSARVALGSKLSSADPDGIRLAYAYLVDKCREVASQRVAVEQAKKAVDDKTAQVLEASKDRKALERLRDYKKNEHSRLLALEEQKLLDEIASTRHARSCSQAVMLSGGAR